MDAGKPERALHIARVLDAALRYIDSGWRVFPVVANTKLPATPHGCLDASTDPAQIREWFGNGRRYNLAIATGNGLTVADVDVKRGVDGFATLATLNLPDTRTARTPSGGQHRYYTVSEAVPNSAGALGPGIDIRGDGGYVVAPPSVIDGTAYIWEDDFPTQALPDATLQRLLEKRAAGDFHELDGQPVPIGQQETTLTRRAASYRHHGLSRDGAIAALWVDVQTWEQDPDQRPWDLSDVEDHVRRAWENIKPGTEEAEILALEALVKPRADAPDADEPRRFSIADARLRLTESFEYLPVLGVDGFIVKGWSHLLAGWWRSGKSEFLAAVVVPWLGRGLKICWITEEPDSLWADRADRFDEIYEPVPWEQLALVDAMSASPQALLKLAAAGDADVIVVDTIREACRITSMRDDEGVVGAVAPWLRRLKDGQRTLVFIAQHRKAAGEHGERVEGTVALPSKFDVVLELTEVDGHDTQRRLSVRRRGSRTPPLLYEMDADERLVVIPDGRARNRVEVEAAVLVVVNAATTPLTTTEVRQRMVGAPSIDTIQRALMSCARDDRITRDPPVTESARRRKPKWSASRQTTAEQLSH
jgi:Bifunctional DNA primase/polymerase, N-terminal/AAA domain